MAENDTTVEDMRLLAKYRTTPSAEQLHVWADNITAIIIERDALRRQAKELLTEHEPDPTPPF